MKAVAVSRHMMSLTPLWSKSPTPTAVQPPGCDPTSSSTGRPLAVLHQPDVDIVGCRIVPGDVAAAIEIEVGRGQRLVSGGWWPTSTLPAHWPLAIFQMSIALVAGLYQAMSLVPSPLKSPVRAGWKPAGCVPISTLPAH